jgi:hypothetical protein
MPIEHKAHRPSSRLLAHLNWLLDEALEQTFPASDPVAIDIDRESHDREAGVFDSRTPLAGNRKVSTETLTRIHQPSRPTHRGDAKQTNCCADGMLQHLALTSRLFKV